DRTVPQAPRAPRPADTLDPPPADMPTGGEPIDFSRPGGRAGAGPATPPAEDRARPAPDRSPRRAPIPMRGAEDIRPRGGAGDAPYGGDAAELLSGDDPGDDPGDDLDALDAPPSDLLTSAAQPVDYSQPG